MRGGGTGHVSVAGLACYRPGHRSRLIYRLHLYRGRKGETKAFTWIEYRDLLIAAHRQLPGGVMVLIWDNLNVHLRAELRAFTSAQPWLHVFQLPSYAPDLNPVEGIWSVLKRGVLANLAVASFAQLIQVIRHGLKKVQYQPLLIEGCLIGTGLSIEPDSKDIVNYEFPVLRRHPGAVYQPEPVSIHQEYLSGIGTAELPRGFDDRFKYSLKIRCGSSDDGKNLARRSELLAHLSQLIGQPFGLGCYLRINSRVLIGRLSLIPLDHSAPLRGVPESITFVPVSSHGNRHTTGERCRSRGTASVSRLVRQRCPMSLLRPRSWTHWSKSSPTSRLPARTVR